MKELVLQRIYLTKATIGVLSEGTDVLMYMLERPWVNNEKNVSCIPEGSYVVTPRQSARFGECFEVQAVEGRTAILIHSGNYVTNTQGCLLPGDQIVDLNGDSIPDVANSKRCVRDLRLKYPEGFKLTVKRG